jgi:Ca2+-binding RTX toxin-like protein
MSSAARATASHYITLQWRYDMANSKVNLAACATLAVVLGSASISAQAAVITCRAGGSTCSGTSGADNITGTAGEDHVLAKAGNDTIRGLASRDSLGGGGGNDSVVGDAGRDYAQGGGENDALDGSLDGVRDTMRGGTGGADTFFYSTAQSGPDRIVDFGENGATPGDVVKLTNLTTATLQATYSNTIEAGDRGVSNPNVGCEGFTTRNNLVINFAAAGIGTYALTLCGLGSSSLAVGSQIVGSP